MIGVGTSIPEAARRLGGGGGGMPAPEAVLLIVAGQSNALKWGTAPDATPSKYANLSHIYVWDTGTSAFVDYVCGTNSGDIGFADSWGSEAEIGYQMNLNFPGVPIFVVKRGKPSTRLEPDGAGDDWAPSSSGELFQGLEDRVTAARAWLASNAVTISDEITCWAQGEADMADPTAAANYGTNIANFLAAYRARISDGFFIFERTRPRGDATEHYTRSFAVREAQLSAALADGYATAIDTDFEADGFTALHPNHPWEEGCGLRCYAAWRGTYNTTYGSIYDTSPNAFTVSDKTDVALASVVQSDIVTPTGFERRATVTVSGCEVQILNPDGVVAVPYTVGPTQISKHQKLQFRLTSSSEYGTATNSSVSVAGVSDTWSVTTAAESTSGNEIETDAFIARMASNGSAALNPSQAAALNNFIATAKADSWWNDLVSGVLLANPVDKATGKINLKGAANLVETGTLTWDAEDGMSPNAVANTSLDLDFNPSAQPQNGVAICVWFSSLSTSSNFDVRSTVGTGNWFGLRLRSDNQFSMMLNNGTITRNTTTTPGLSTSIGCFIAARVASNDVDYYGPAGTAIDTSPTTSGTPAATDATFGFSAGATSARKAAAILLFGAALTATKAQSIRNSLNSLGLAWNWTGAA